MRGLRLHAFREVAWIQGARALPDEHARLLQAVQTVEDIEVASQRRHVHGRGYLLTAQTIRRAGAVEAFEQMTQGELRRYIQCELLCDVAGHLAVDSRQRQESGGVAGGAGPEPARRRLHCEQGFAPTDIVAEQLREFGRVCGATRPT